MRLKDLYQLAKESIQAWKVDEAPRLAAALAFYTILSLAPLLVIAVGIAGLVFGEQAAEGQIVGQIQGLIGPQGAEAVQGLIENANRPSGGIAATIIGVITLLLGGMGVFNQLRGALNSIWEVSPPAVNGIKANLRRRVLPFVMVLGVGFLLLVSLVLSAALAAVGRVLSTSLPGGEIFWRLANLVISVLVFAGLFALIFRFVPDVDIEWKDVGVGALVTSALFTLGQFAMGLYLGRSTFASAFGAAGSLVVLLVWVYYSAQILFLGAEFTEVYASKYGSLTEPIQDARILARGNHSEVLEPQQEVDGLG